MKLLVIDDDKTYTESLKEFFISRLEGVQVEIVNDAKFVQSTAELFRPDLIFLDLGLSAHPEDSGIPVLAALKKSVYTKKIPVIVISGYNGAHILKQVIKCGIHEFVIKPVDMEDLLKRIKIVLGKVIYKND